MPYRNKTYVAFDADNDMAYYRTIQMWEANDNIDFNFHNAHELNNLRSTSSEATIKRKLKERLYNTKLMIVLIGEHTKNLFKFVRWEIDVGIDMKLPIIAVNLNCKRDMDSDLCPPILKCELVLHIPFKQKAIQWAIDNWIDGYNIHKRKMNFGPMVLTKTKYDQLGL